MDLDCKEALEAIIKRRRDVRAEFTGDPLGEEELADLMGTITYELMCLITARVPRIYA